MLHNLFQVQIKDAGKEETALAVYWVIEGVDRCRVDFVPWHLIKHMGKHNGVSMQVTDVYSAVDDKPWFCKSGFDFRL